MLFLDVKEPLSIRKMELSLKKILSKIFSRGHRIFHFYFKTLILRTKLKSEEFSVIHFSLGKNPRLFNLDLHSSVIRDLNQELLRRSEITLTSWSISRHNQTKRRYLGVPDPVQVINSKTWKDLTELRIEEFQRRYDTFLKKFDGFIVTTTPAFTDLFWKYEKPMLILNATRYEAPYTEFPERWEMLNRNLISQHLDGRIKIVSNNRGDLEYLKQKTGIQSQLIPSLCDYINE
jgi:hypothetical protein